MSFEPGGSRHGCPLPHSLYDLDVLEAILFAGAFLDEAEENLEEDAERASTGESEDLSSYESECGGESRGTVAEKEEGRKTWMW